jgi:O-antigen/teichoic acid export membrane protein
MRDDRERMTDVWIRATRLVALVSIPSLLGLAVVAPDFVSVVLGRRWASATGVIQILAIVGIVQSLQALNGEVLLALGRANWLLRFTAVWFVGSIGAFAVGIHWGVMGVATCYTAATVLIEPLRTYLTTRALDTTPWRLLRSLGGVVQASIGMAVVVASARAMLVAVGVGPVARLPILVVAGAAAYIAGCFWRAPEITSEVTGALRGRGRARVPRVEPVDAPL